MFILFIYKLPLLILYMWYFSNVFKCFPFPARPYKVYYTRTSPCFSQVLNIWFEYNYYYGL
jgi:hypothetical protein